MATNYNNYGVVFKSFANMTEFHRYLENGVVQDGFKSSPASQETDDERWYGTKSYSVADELYMKGDKENAKKIDQLSGGIRELIRKYAAQKPMMKKYVSVAGFMPHVPNYIAGVPTSMIAARRTKVPERVTDILINMQIDCSVSCEEIIKTMVELFKAIMMIESNGTRINLYSGEMVHNDAAKQFVGLMVKIKDSRQPIDIVKMVYPLVHPSMLRRHDFRFMEVTKGVDPSFHCGYGRVGEDNTKKLREIAKNAHVTDFYEIRRKNADEIVKVIFQN